MTLTLQAGSPRYIELLADAATTAETAIAVSDQEMWQAFDLAWENLVADPHPLALSYFSTVGLALLRRLTGTPVPVLAAEATRLHVDKNAGYAGIGNQDPWANFRLAAAFGVSPFLGVMVRLSDKYIRTQNLRRNPDNERVAESITDTLRDAVAYPLIGRCLLEEGGLDGGSI
jgi:hypothetical protein